MLKMIQQLSGMLKGENPKYLAFILSVATDSDNPLFSTFWDAFRDQFRGQTNAPRDAYGLFRQLRDVLGAQTGR